MTDKDIRNEWEKHYGDILPKEEVDKAFTKVMNSADNLEKTQTKIIRTGFKAQDIQSGDDLRRGRGRAVLCALGDPQGQREAERSGSGAHGRTGKTVRDLHPQR